MLICFIFHITFASGANTIKIMVESMVADITKFNPHSSQEGGAFMVDYTNKFTLRGANSFYNWI